MATTRAARPVPYRLEFHSLMIRAASFCRRYLALLVTDFAVVMSAGVETSLAVLN